MKKTFDTNIFVYSTLSKICSDLIIQMLKNPQEYITIRSVKKEVETKLMELYKIFIILQSEYTNNVANILESKRYSLFKQKYPQLYSALLKYVKNGYFRQDKRFNDFKTFLSELLNHINKILTLTNKDKYLFPIKNEDYERLTNDIKFKKVIITLSFIKNESDREHIGISNSYIEQSKNDLEFITIEKYSLCF